MTTHRSADPRRRERAKGIVTLACALVIGLVAGGATWSAFNAQTHNQSNQFEAGTVTITDNDAGSALFSLAAMRPGNPASRCLQVTYTGSLSAGVTLYGGTTGGTGLESYLQLTVVRGSNPGGTFGDCTGFTADAADYQGYGNGVLFSGLLSTYPVTRAAGLTDPTATWATGESHWYMFTVDVSDTDAAEGKSATQTFTWDAR